MGEIIVGIDDSAASAAALRYAVEESRRRGVTLHLMHIAPEALSVVGARAFGSLEAELRAAADERLAWACAYAAARLPADRISHETSAGLPSRALVSAARQAGVDSIVLGADRTSIAERLVFGAVTPVAAAVATVPLVAVPEGWQPHVTHRRVLVAVRHPGAVSLRSVRRGLELAAARHASLGIVHVGHEHRSRAEVLRSSGDLQAWRAGVARLMRHQIEPLQAAFPEVPVDLVVTFGSVVEEIGRLATEADLLVIERRRAPKLPGNQLGRISKRLLRACPCPVEVEPPASGR